MSPYVDEFLEARARDHQRDTESARLLATIVRQYQDAVNSRDWPASKALGALMVEVAEGYSDHPDYVTRWTAP